jgi:hypothetical protein
MRIVLLNNEKNELFFKFQQVIAEKESLILSNIALS